MPNDENTRKQTDSIGLNWADDAPKGGKAVLNRREKKGTENV